MALWIPDTIDGSELDIQGQIPTKVRGGLITGMTGDAATALDGVLDALEQNGVRLGDTYPFRGQVLYTKRVTVKAISPDVARVQIYYDSDFGGQPSAYIITSRAYLTSYTTNLVPGTKEPIRTGAWTDASNASNSIPADNVTFTFQRPMREVSVSGVKQGTNPPPGTYDGFIGFANDGEWLGLVTGSWLLTNGGTEVSKYKGFFSYHLSALTKNTEDWSETGILQSKQTGRYAKVQQDDIDALVAKPYDPYAVFTGNGIVRVCPYPTVDFSQLFGF